MRLISKFKCISLLTNKDEKKYKLIAQNQGKTLARLREGKKLTLELVENKIEITANRLDKLENALISPYIGVLYELCKIYEFNIKKFVQSEYQINC